MKNLYRDLEKCDKEMGREAMISKMKLEKPSGFPSVD